MNDDISNASQPLYEKVAAMIRKNIENGTFLPGSKIPSLRETHRNLNVSISTVTLAYNKLEDRGLIECHSQSGYFVRQQPRSTLLVKQNNTEHHKPSKVSIQENVSNYKKTTSSNRLIAFGNAVSATEHLPVKSLHRVMRQLTTEEQHDAIKYSLPPGNSRLRRQIAFRSADLGASISPSEIILTNGATEALLLSLQAVAAAGDVIAVESPTYHRLLQIIEQLGMLAVEIETNPVTGMDLDSLQKTINEIDVAAVFIVPNFTNPLGSLMPDDKKRQLVEMLSSKRIPLIEDDVYGELYFGDKRPQSARSYDKDNFVINCSSFSKSLSPGYRIGWVATRRYYDAILRNKQAIYGSNTSITELVIAKFLREGHFDRHLVRLRRTLHHQMQMYRFAIIESFPEGTQASCPSGGLVLWIKLPKGVDGNELHRKALLAGISITPGTLFALTPKYKNYIRICYSPPWSDEVKLAIKTMGEIARQIG